MKEKRSLESIQIELEEYTRKLLEDAGYTILSNQPNIVGSNRLDDLQGEKGFSVVLDVTGYSCRYDFWNYDLDSSDWKTVLSVGWSEKDRRILEFMRDHDNENMPVTRLERARITTARDWKSSFHPVNAINKELTKNKIPYHFGLTHTRPKSKNGHPTMIRMFKYPQKNNT